MKTIYEITELLFEGQYKEIILYRVIDDNCSQMIDKKQVPLWADVNDVMEQMIKDYEYVLNKVNTPMRLPRIPTQGVHNYRFSR